MVDDSGEVSGGGADETMEPCYLIPLFGVVKEVEELGEASGGTSGEGRQQWGRRMLAVAPVKELGLRFNLIGPEAAGDEIALQRAANMVATNKDQYVVVLFFASWCPFSKKCLPNFNSMASLFPSIPHFAFEELVIRPSVLSRYGVHGFPTFFLLHSSMRVRYHGSRSISSLTFFYSNVTGLAPTSLDSTALKKATIVTNITEHTSGQESCPFSWARSPEKLLQQDTYLALATSFVILRLLYLLWPKLAACFKIAWRRQSRFASLMSLWDYFQSFLQQAKRGSFSRLKHSKRGNLQEGAISAKAWASKSLVSVSFGEPGSVRAQSSNERR